MPVISKEQKWFEGKSFPRVLKCDQAGDFFADLPEAAAEALGHRQVIAKSKADFEKAWDEALKKYSELKTSTRRVILYRLSAEASIYRNEQCIFKSSSLNPHGVEIALQAGVFDEVITSHSDGTKRYAYNQVENALPHSIESDNRNNLYPGRGERAERQIEWTKDHQDFFTRLAIAMENIVMELSRLDCPDSIVEIIASGALTFGQPKQLKNK